ncbi:C2H2-type zinc finger protein [Aspergillus udagawae]|uniref:C2H2-type domain-containing protein n=1 Tax=Aspergillus udagawae TaxID=91492 RepID=A0A8E0UVD7_9EURO|nr:uncharacterized protein Aud_003651 [Aspergillus udagawae]GIC87267.1 hypothetical protein Aud_003651 [Aspergillus udagawae]
MSGTNLRGLDGLSPYSLDEQNRTDGDGQSRGMSLDFSTKTAYLLIGLGSSNPDDHGLLDPTLSIHQSIAGPQRLEQLVLNSQLTQSSTSLPLSLDSAQDDSSGSMLFMEGYNDPPIPSWLMHELEAQETDNVLSASSQQYFTNGLVPSELLGSGTGPSSGIGNRIPAPGAGLPRRRSRYLTRSSGREAAPIVIPNASALNPMERWRESPPEDEPASMAAILDALKQTPAQQSGLPDNENPDDPTDIANAFRHYRRAASATSGESSGSSKASQQSVRSRSSVQDSTGVQTGRRRRRVDKPVRRNRDVTEKRRRYCCTFCCDRFKSKYDWARHEKSLHLNLEAWYCAPFGTRVDSPVTLKSHCAFCNAVDPDSRHLDQHAHRACESDSGARRSFRRKDHLVQHLRLVHNADPPPCLDDWKIGQSAVSSRCGFCDQRLSTWEHRIEHLGEHFRKGATMNEWRGEHEFPAEFAAQVVNALPPYLIGPESRSVIPFSATNSDVRDHFSQISSRAFWDSPGNQEEAALNLATVAPSQPLQTLAPGLSPAQLSSFTQVLTLHLSRYAQQQMKQGIIPTDEMFQQESRRVLYDSEDSWNQTIADNPEWLSTFRRLHCDETT